jgi:triacylglycerol lipase
MLLSVVDSPAYANLTSSYLNRTFNPSTPDDPRVKYFSVAGRLGSVGVWHPFWLPKMVLDGAEERARDKMRKQYLETNTNDHFHPSDVSDEATSNKIWEKDEEWGNDGLVTVQSAKWGEFLGTLEGCDHWEMRGARGLVHEWPGLPTGKVDLNLGLGVGKLVGSLKREDSGGMLRRSLGERKKDRDQDEADVRRSTDRMSAVLDWLVDQVPSSSKSKAGEKKVGVREKRNELGTKEGLERFYVALSRKLWDEGL